MLRLESESFMLNSRNQLVRFRIDKPKQWGLAVLRTVLRRQIERAETREIIIIDTNSVLTLESEDLSKVREQKGIALERFLNTYANRMKKARSVIIDAVNPLRNFIEQELPPLSPLTDNP